MEPCTKSALVSAINSFGAARASGDNNLTQLAVQLVSQQIDTLAFAPEPEPVVEEKASE